jgi:hypothetical protein
MDHICQYSSASSSILNTRKQKRFLATISEKLIGCKIEKCKAIWYLFFINEKIKLSAMNMQSLNISPKKKSTDQRLKLSK